MVAERLVVPEGDHDRREREGANLAESAGRVPLLIRLHSGNFQFDGLADNGADIASSPPTTRRR